MTIACTIQYFVDTHTYGIKAQIFARQYHNEHYQCERKPRYGDKYFCNYE